MDKDQKEIFGNYSVLIPLIGGILLSGLLLFTIQSVVTPFLVIASIEFLLYPIRQLRLAKRIMWLAFLLFLAWFLFELGGILLPFIISFLLAYLFNPLVLKLELLHFPRWLSSLLVIIVLITIIAAGIVFIMPIAIQQFDSVLSTVSDKTNQIVTFIKDGRVFVWLSHYGIPVDYSKELLTQQLSSRLEVLLKNFLVSTLSFFSSISNIITQIINLLIIPFLTFYLLKDFPTILKTFKEWIPHVRKDFFLHYFSEVDKLMGKYLRGALTVALIHGTLAAILLSLFGINYAVMLGMIAGALSLIPFVGLFISLSLSLIVALFSGDPVWLKVVFVFVTYGFMQMLEAFVLSPYILGKQVGLHPVLLILSLMVFGYFAGFLGLLIAVPSTSLIVLTVKILSHHRNSKIAEDAV